MAKFYHFSPASLDDVSSFIVKFGYNACCHWLKEMNIWPRSKLVLCPSISQTSLLLFSLIESEISEQASRGVAKEEPNKGL